jgi:hypothetical protein
LSLTLLSACGGVPTMVSEEVKISEERIAAEPVVGTLTVLKAEEGRPLAGESEYAGGYLILIPLWPYGWQEMTPEFIYEQGKLAPYDFRGDITKIMVKDLRAAGIANEVVIGGEVDTSGTGSHQLRVILKEGIWHRHPTFYCLSLPGLLFYSFGLPVSYGSGELKLELELLDGSGTVVGKQEFTEKESATQWPWSSAHCLMRALAVCYQKMSPKIRNFVLSTLRK